MNEYELLKPIAKFKCCRHFLLPDKNVCFESRDTKLLSNYDTDKRAECDKRTHVVGGNGCNSKFLNCKSIAAETTKVC